MKTYGFTLEVDGTIKVYVEADNMDEAIDKAWDSVELGDLEDYHAEIIDIDTSDEEDDCEWF